MRIAFILPSLANKGPIILAKELIGFLISQGYRCDVYYFDDIIELNFPCSTTRISFFKRFDFNKYQVIHSHMLRPDAYCAIYKWRIGKFTKVISTIHTAIYDDLKYTYGHFRSNLTIPFWRIALLKMDHVVVLTETAKRYYSNAKFKGLTVINNGRDIPQCADPILEEDRILIEHLKKNHTLLGSVCVLDKRKGLEQVIQLLVKQKDFIFLIVGDGIDKTNLEITALRYGVSDRVKILGARKDGYRYISHFDLFLIPSRSEGMPLALLEAMALKVPIVCARIPAFAEEHKDNEFSFFTLDDIEGLKNACDKAILNADQMTTFAYNQYKEKYTVVRMAEKYIRLYNSLTES